MESLNYIDNLLSTIETTNSKSMETLQAVNLDWRVNKVQLCTPDGTPVDYYANQRSDNGTVLHVVKDSYSILQNDELVELCEALAQSFDYKVHKGGELHGGRKVYLQLEAGSLNGIGENRDTIEKYITAVNSFDGTTSLAFGSLGFTISCQNTFYRAARHANMTRIRHTASMHDKIDAAKRQIEDILQDEQTMYEKFFKMASEPVTNEHIKQIVQKTLEIDINKPANEVKDLYSTRKVNIAEGLLASIKSEMSYKGDTLWGLMSGVTQFTSHKQAAPNRTNGRIESKLVGQAQNMDAIAYNYLSSLVM